MKQVVVKLIRTETHPWNPNVVEYDVISMVDGEPVTHVSGVQLPVVAALTTITASTTLGAIQTACETHATAQSYLP